jgi:hypothetical protein
MHACDHCRVTAAFRLCALFVQQVTLQVTLLWVRVQEYCKSYDLERQDVRGMWGERCS